MTSSGATLPLRNIASHLADMARLQPERPAVICAQGRGARGEVAYAQLSFGELEAASNRLALGLEGIGIGRGVRTALMVPPSPEFFILSFALFKAGAVPVLIDPGIGIRHLKACLAHAQPEAFIGIAKAHITRAVLGWARESLRTHVFVGGNGSRMLARLWDGHTFDELLHRHGDAASYTAAEPAPGETAAILFTSGGTGTPKGAEYTHEIFGAQVAHIRALYGIEPGERDLATFPLFALFGPALGMTAVVPEMDASRPATVDPRHIISAIEKFSITNMFGSPALINRVGRHGEANHVKLPTLRRVISAGAPMPARVLARFVAMLSPGVQVFTPYGATECLPVASIGSDEVLGETAPLTEEGAGVCIGRPVAGLEVKVIRITDQPIAEWDAALELPAGQTGEIIVRAAHATRRYFNLPEATALAKIPDPASGGFYHRMGDVGYIDARGRLWFCGRKAHRVETAGGTRFSIPCEGVFNRSPRVFRTALVGVRRNGTLQPVLCVELEASARRDARDGILAELRELGSRHDITRDIDTFLFHPSFPVDVRHNAKIFRDRLALWAERQLS